MNETLPTEFLERMKNYLKDDYSAFLETYDAAHSTGLRLNTLKISISQFVAISPFSLEPIPWTEDGFYYENNDKPGKHPFHSAGLYYIQEPSAMTVAKVLEPQPGEKVLDLSAAPGGKSTHISVLMDNKGLLVSNEISRTRVKALVENIERFGTKHAVITSESPERLSPIFPEYFDRILVDAPCSGEGMFRKNPQAIKEWSLENVKQCAIRQANILDEAQKMLKPNGILVYSTCTFSPEENEGTISNFIRKYPNFQIESIPTQLSDLFSQGNPEWIGKEKEAEIENTVRLWPHKLKGEGHFIAKLRKNDANSQNKESTMKYIANKDALKYFMQFAEKYLALIPEGNFHSFGTHLYMTPDKLPDLRGIKIERLGWHLGELKKNRFEPSHALAMGLTTNQVKQYIDLADDMNLVEKYLKGETLNVDSNLKGWTLVTVNKFPIGWGKMANGQLKNHLPKGLRRIH